MKKAIILQQIALLEQSIKLMRESISEELSEKGETNTHLAYCSCYSYKETFKTEDGYELAKNDFYFSVDESGEAPTVSKHLFMGEIPKNYLPGRTFFKEEYNAQHYAAKKTKLFSYNDIENVFGYATECHTDAFRMRRMRKGFMRLEGRVRRYIRNKL